MAGAWASTTRDSQGHSAGWSLTDLSVAPSSVQTLHRNDSLFVLDGQAAVGYILQSEVAVGMLMWPVTQQSGHS